MRVLVAILAFALASVAVKAAGAQTPYALYGEGSCDRRDEMFAALRERGGVSLGHYRRVEYGMRRGADGEMQFFIADEQELALWIAADRSEFIVVTSGLRTDPQWGEHTWSCVTARGDKMSPFPTLNPEKKA